MHLYHMKYSIIFTRNWLPVTITGLIIGLLYLLCQDYIAKPWHDEIGTADSAINLVTKGTWFSNIWHYTYQPLHAIILTIWLKVFGVSHSSVCNLNITLTIICFLIIESHIINNKLLSCRNSGFVFTFAFWFNFYLSSFYTKGRIDILVMLFTILLVCELFKKNIYNWTLVRIFIYGILLICSGIYVVPLIAVNLIFCWAINYENRGRKIWFLQGIVVLFGFLFGFFLTCLFHYNHHFLLHYLSSFITFNSTIGNSQLSLLERIIRGYSDISSIIGIIVVLIMLLFAKFKQKISIYILYYILLIPAIMVLIGRYQTYYRWIFLVPLTIYALYLYDNLQQKKFKIFYIAILIIMAGFRLGYWIKVRTNEMALRNKGELFIKGNRSIMNNYSDIYIRDLFLYYPLLDLNKTIWFLENDNMNIAESISNNKYLSSLLKNIDYKEDYPPITLPIKGVMITVSEDEYKEEKNKMLNNGYSLKTMKYTAPYRMVEFSK